MSICDIKLYLWFTLLVDCQSGCDRWKCRGGPCGRPAQGAVWRCQGDRVALLTMPDPSLDFHNPLVMCRWCESISRSREAARCSSRQECLTAACVGQTWMYE